MTAIREPGKIDDHTTLIDFGYSDVSKTGGVYFIEAEKTCLIDSGTKAGAPKIIKKLKEMNVFPPDYVILTHSHWDHSQGVNILRKKAQSEQKPIEVFASEKSIPLLEDQSFNRVFHPKQTFENINDVSPLKEGDIVDLDSVTLRIFDTPGHIKDHISVLDESNKNIFVGDSIGIKVADNAFMSPIMPPFCNKNEYNATIQKLKQIDYESLSLAHFGYIFDEEAINILDESKRAFDQTWQIFESAEEISKLEDIDYIYETIMKEMNPSIPEFELEKFIARFMLQLINGVRRIARKEPYSTATIMVKEVLNWQIDGYKLAKNQ